MGTSVLFLLVIKSLNLIPCIIAFDVVCTGCTCMSEQRQCPYPRACVTAVPLQQHRPLFIRLFRRALCAFPTSESNFLKFQFLSYCIHFLGEKIESDNLIFGLYLRVRAPQYFHLDFSRIERSRRVNSKITGIRKTRLAR